MHRRAQRRVAGVIGGTQLSGRHAQTVGGQVRAIEGSRVADHGVVAFVLDRSENLIDDVFDPRRTTERLLIKIARFFLGLADQRRETLVAR